LLSLFGAASALHLAFVNAGWFGRYETYLMAPGVVVIAIAAKELMPTRPGDSRFPRARLAPTLAWLLLTFTVLLSYYNRLILLGKLPVATTNIYEQPWQVGRFLKEFYPGRPVVINDVGAINYEADIRCLDLYGLASLEVAKEGLRNVPLKDWFHDLATSGGVKIAVVYRWAFVLDSPDVTSPPWIRVGNWTIAHNVGSGDAIVSFFAADTGSADTLAAHLREFAPKLPGTVAQDGAYLH
jgi:hypothetical protein